MPSASSFHRPADCLVIHVGFITAQLTSHRKEPNHSTTLTTVCSFFFFVHPLAALQISQRMDVSFEWNDPVTLPPRSLIILISQHLLSSSLFSEVECVYHRRRGTKCRLRLQSGWSGCAASLKWSGSMFCYYYVKKMTLKCTASLSWPSILKGVHTWKEIWAKFEFL